MHASTLGLSAIKRSRIASGSLGVREVIDRPPKLLAGPDDIVFGDRRVLRAALGEQVAAKQRFGGVIEQDAAVPSVRDVRRIDPLELVLAGRKLLAIGSRGRDGRRRRSPTPGRRCRSKTARLAARLPGIVHRAGFVGLEM